MQRFVLIGFLIEPGSHLERSTVSHGYDYAFAVDRRSCDLQGCRESRQVKENVSAIANRTRIPNPFRQHAGQDCTAHQTGFGRDSVKTPMPNGRWDEPGNAHSITCVILSTSVAQT